MKMDTLLSDKEIEALRLQKRIKHGYNLMAQAKTLEARKLIEVQVLELQGALKAIQPEKVNPVCGLWQKITGGRHEPA